MSTIINGTSNAITFPDGTIQNSAVVAPSSAGQIPFSTNGTTYSATQKIVSGTAVASTSGTSIDFTSIPSWVKRITVMFSGVSLSGTSSYLIQLGDSGGIEATGYTGSSLLVVDAAVSQGLSYTTGFGIVSTSAGWNYAGTLTLNLVNSATNLWVSSHALGRTDAARSAVGGGTKSLSGTLTQVRITTVNGTDTFDAGSINILYE